MLRVGLTGNIASGKSSVAATWRALGATVIDADVLARRAVEPGTRGLAAIVAVWGPAVLDASGALDRAALRDVVFRDPAARARLEAIVHPAVAALREEEYRAALECGAAIVVADIPLLYEVGMEGDFDAVVLVDAPEAVRRARLVELRGLDPAEAGRMIAAQMSAEAKRDLADFIIDNTGTLADLEERAAEVWRALERRASQAAPEPGRG
jgi:dephospho-CoA kinase